MYPQAPDERLTPEQSYTVGNLIRKQLDKVGLGHIANHFQAQKDSAVVYTDEALQSQPMATGLIHSQRWNQLWSKTMRPMQLLCLHSHTRWMQRLQQLLGRTQNSTNF